MLINAPIDINPAAWEAWKKDRVTQEVVKALRAELDSWEGPLREGDTIMRPGSEIADTAKAVGIIYGLDCFLVGIEEVLRAQWEQEQQDRLEGGEVEDGG